MCRKLFLLISVALVLALVGSNLAFGDVLERTIAAESDDAEEDIGGSASFVMDLTSSDLEFSYDNNTSDPLDLQLVGIRFVDIAIPKGSIITSASVQFQADDVDDAEHVGDAYVIIEGELSLNPGTFLEDASNISLRPRTTALVPWGPAHWTVKGDKYSTSDITSVIQEIVDQDGWASGNALVLIFSQDPANPSTGVVEAEAGPGDDAALLRIEFGGAPAPPEPEPAPPEPEPTPPVPVEPVVLERTIVDESDDAEEDIGGSAGFVMDLTSSDLEFSYDNNTSDPLDLQLVGIRFVDIAIPKGSIITSASVQFQADDVDDAEHVGDAYVIIEGELSLNPGTFLEDASNISLRPRTTALVPWGPAHWTVKGDKYSTSDITSVIQEIVDQDGWASGNALVLIFSQDPANPSTGVVEAEAGPGDDAALLRIEFGGAPAPPEPEPAPPEPEPTPPAPAEPVVVERRVSASSDDAEEHVLEGNWMESLTSSDLELAWEGGSSLQTVGIRLLDIQIPHGATITSAWVQFDADDVDNDYHVLDVSLIIEGEGSPNPVTFSMNDGDITSRLVTTASVVWDIPQWMVKHGQGPEEQTPDISAVIQEIVDQPDWAAGNAIVLLFRDNPDKPSVGTREAESFDGTADAAPLLHIEYVVGEAPAPPEPEPAPPEPEPAPPEPEPEPPAPVNEWRIAAGSDDAEEHLDDLGEMELDSSDLELAWEKWLQDDKQVVGLRFTDITIPKGAKIKKAWVQFEVDETKGGTYPVYLIIDGELSANAATFSKADRDISSRPRTISGEWWDVPSWDVKGEQGSAQKTPDIADIIQEIVNQDGWASGNSLVLIFEQGYSRYISTGVRCAESFEGKAEAAPLLHIDVAQ